MERRTVNREYHSRNHSKCIERVDRYYVYVYLNRGYLLSVQGGKVVVVNGSVVVVISENKHTSKLLLITSLHTFVSRPHFRRVLDVFVFCFYYLFQ